MIGRLRIVVLVTRPAVAGLLAMFTATGLAGGHGEDWALLARALAAVFGFLLFSVACNDLADEAIDRVNLPGQRPLETGAVGRREFAIIGGTAGAVALGASATLHWPALVVTTAGLAVSAGYSLRPVRLADRGAVAAVVLPACYVAVPFLVGFFAASTSVRPGTLLLLGRPVHRVHRPDTPEGLPRRPRRRAVRQADLPGPARPTLDLRVQRMLLGHGHRDSARRRAQADRGAGARVRQLPGWRPVAAAGSWPARLGGQRDECVIGAIAILGRGVLLLLLAHLSMVQAGWPAWRYGATIGALAVLIAGQAVSMARHGPVTRVTIPVGWDIPATRSAQSTELSATAVARDDTQSSRPPGVAGTSTACS